MKKFALILLGLYFISGLYGQKTINFESEKEAIFSAIEGVKKGFDDKNMELIKLHVINDSRFMEVGTGFYGKWITNGFSQYENGTRKLWEDESIKGRSTSVKLIDLEIYKDAALAIIEVDWKITKTKTEEIDKVNHIETVFLVKESKRWKIAGSQLFYYNKTIKTIAITGTALPGGWDQSVLLTQSVDSQDLWKVKIELNDGEIKFRANNEWEINWGGLTFPNGTLEDNGPNIKVQKGFYHVSFNFETKEYSFIKIESDNN